MDDGGGGGGGGGEDRVSSVPIKRCHVCGDIALNFNFRGLACQSCKVFFTRNALRSSGLVCLREGQCEITLKTRKQCSACRLQKCFAIGMRKELIASKRVRGQQTPTRTAAEATNNGQQQQQQQQQQQATQPNPLETSRQELLRLSINKTSVGLNSFDLQCLAMLRHASRMFIDENTVELQPKSLSLLQILSAMALYARPIVGFCKRFDTWLSLPHSDQLVLVKEFYPLCLSLRFIVNYDFQAMGFRILSSTAGEQSVFVRAKMFGPLLGENNITRLREIRNEIHRELEDDETVKDLLNASLLFQPSVRVSCGEFVEYQKHFYNHLLKRYVISKHASYEHGQRKFGRLMHVIELLKEARTMYVTDIMPRIDASCSNQLMIEIFDMF